MFTVFTELVTVLDFIVFTVTVVTFTALEFTVFTVTVFTFTVLEFTVFRSTCAYIYSVYFHNSFIYITMFTFTF